MCMHIGADYRTISEAVWFSFDTLMHLHVLHVLLKSQVNISYGFHDISIFVFLS